MSNSAGGSGYGSGWKWSTKRGRSKSPARGKSKSPSRQYVTKRQLSSLVPKIMNKKAEGKHIHHTFASATADQNGTVYHLTKIDDGVLPEERVGNNIMVTGFEFGGYFNNDETAESVLCRFMVFRANEGLTATPAVNQILATGSVGTTRVPTCLYNPLNLPTGPAGSNNGKPAYTVYYDKTFGMSDEGSSVTKVPFRVNIKLPRPLPCNFTGIEDTDEGPGQWYCLYCSSNATTTVQLNGDFRVYYTDC